MNVNRKKIPAETLPLIGGGRIKAEWWRGRMQVCYM
jgi:hypothetical protein